MMRVQYFANFADDVAVTMSDISKICTRPSNFFLDILGFWDLMDFNKSLTFQVSILLFQGNHIKLFIRFLT